MLKFLQQVICPCCGRNSYIHVIMTYTTFTFFFIPIFKFDKKYYVVTDCCSAWCRIDKETGKAIARGEIKELDISRLQFFKNENFNGQYNNGCGYSNFDQNAAGYVNEHGTGANNNRYGNQPNNARYGQADGVGYANNGCGQQASANANSYIDPDGIKRVRVKKCPSCGFETGENFKYCPNCGGKF